ncbi:MAG: coenzyme F420-0:L-glutamate ligase [Bdellovibrionales bacterium]|nr:coenzyme F420-0:L-glutamate ligase [Bdellovibrionales bacterium]
MKATAVRTRILKRGEDLFDFIVEGTRPPSDASILAVTSKIASIAEERIVPKKDIEKLDLIKREADVYLGEIMAGVSLTIKEGLFIPSAGIDESNADGEYYILYPERPADLTRLLWTRLKKHWGLKNFGLILTDSHTHPLRRGVTGIALSSFGFDPVHELVGEPDLFGKPFKYSAVNVVDSLATTAALMMGEGKESSPLAWIESAPVRFKDVPETQVSIAMEKDLYLPIYKSLIEKSKR